MRLFAVLLCVLFAVGLAGCRGDDDDLIEALALNQQTQVSPPPRVGAEFQTVVTQLASQGLRLKEALEASFDGTSRHLAAIFESEKPKQPNEAYELRIFESGTAAARTIFRRAEFFFTFDARELHKINGSDINGDGLKEVIAQSSSGGNCWSCNPVEIYRVRDHRAELIAAGPIRKISDLNGDGLQELIVMDSRWESYGELSHAASPAAVMIYSWQNGRYVYSSRDYQAFYKGELSRLREQAEQARGDITAEDFSDEQYVGLAISIAVTRAHAGEVEEGLKEMGALFAASARSDEQKTRRAQIMDDFLKGESAARLRQLKPGDPLPIN
ncbi:MAG TPA: hypothetical protein VIG62_13130 [Blastocatellia bacterium]